MGRRIFVLLIGLVLICGLVGCNQEPRMITVTFDANGADSGDVPPSIEIERGSKVVMPASGNLKKKGYFLLGWGKEPDTYMTNSYSIGSEYSVFDSEIYYALWHEGYSDGEFGYSDWERTKLVGPLNRDQSSYIVPDGVLTIGDSAFYDCGNLKSITLPTTIECIGSNAFIFCDSLIDINIPTSVTSIGCGAFSYCTRLRKVTIPSSVKSFSNVAFSKCKNLTVIFEEGMETIPDYALSCWDGDTGIVSVVLPSSIVSIGRDAFLNCAGLTEMTIPTSVATIDHGALSGCSGLTKINYNSTIEDWNAISKGYGWDYGTPSYTIHCTDGDISK